MYYICDNKTKQKQKIMKLSVEEKILLNKSLISKIRSNNDFLEVLSNPTLIDTYKDETIKLEALRIKLWDSL